MLDELQEWLRFIRAESYLLRERPSLLFQQAFNQPESSVFALAAERGLEAGEENRTWLRWLNKPKSRSACLATLKPSELHYCAYSPNGNLIVTHANRYIELWNAETTERLALLQGHEGLIRWVEFSPGGKRLVSGAGSTKMGYKNGEFYSHGSGDLKVWDVTTRSEMASAAAHTSPTMRSVFSPDGKLIATGAEDGTVKLWDSSDLTELVTLNGHTGSIKSCVFSPDTSRLVTASEDGTLKLWSIDRGARPSGGLFKQVTFRVTDSKKFVVEEVATLRGHTAAINGCVISPGGDMVVSFSKDHTLCVWGIRDGWLLETLEGHRDEVLQAKFSRGGKVVASCGQDKDLKLWDSSTGRELRTLSGHQMYVTDCDFSPDDRLLVSCSGDKTLKLWEVETGSELATFAGHTSIVYNCLFSPDGSRILSGSMDHTAMIWDPDVDQQGTVRTTHGTGVKDCDFSDDGMLVASVASGDSLRLWGFESSQSRLIGSADDQMVTCRFALNSRAVLTASRDGVVNLWSIRSRDRIAEFREPNCGETYCEISPDGRRIFKASRGWYSSTTTSYAVYERPPYTLWDVTSGKQIAAFGDLYDDILGCRFSPDGSMIVTAGSGEAPVKLWDGYTGRELRQLRLPGHDKGIAHCAFSPDLRRLAAGSGDRSVTIWRIADGDVLFRGKAHGNTVWRCTFSPDASLLASGDYDGTIKVWDWRLGEEIASIPAHTARVDDLIFSPDAALLFSRCTREGALKLWDAETGEWRGEYRSGSRIEAAAIDRRWQRLAVGSAGSEFDLLEVINLGLGPAIATAWKDANGSLGCACPNCAQWHEIHESSLAHEIRCAGCESVMRLNDFVVTAEWRPVAQATAY